MNQKWQDEIWKAGKRRSFPSLAFAHHWFMALLRYKHGPIYQVFDFSD